MLMIGLLFLLEYRGSHAESNEKNIGSGHETHGKKGKAQYAFQSNVKPRMYNSVHS